MVDEGLEKRSDVGLLSVAKYIAWVKEVEFSCVLDVASALDSSTFSTVSCSRDDAIDGLSKGAN